MLKEIYQLMIIVYFCACCGAGACQVVLVVKKPSANAGDVREVNPIPGLGRFLGGGHDNPLQYSCLENPMDRGAWMATVHGVTKSQTCMKQLSLHASGGLLGEE